jgi:hypothetical protein
MRSFCNILFLIFLYQPLFSQELTGQWKGYFTPNAELNGKIFSYEINIKESNSHEIVANTLSRFSAFSIAKAMAKGTHNLNTHQVSIEETKFDNVKLETATQACLMTNYLTHSEIRGFEILQGNYTSVNMLTGKDCGGGSVYLERSIPVVKINKNKAVTVSTDSKTLVKNTNTAKDKITTSKSTQATATTKNITNNSNVASAANNSFSNNNISSSNESILPEDAVVENKNPVLSKLIKEESKDPIDLEPMPWLLISRENKLVKKIITHEKNISIDLYDNGTIDNDTVIVFDNRHLIVNKKRLSYKAIHFDVNFTDNQKTHEVIIVAHNMGSVPPNTALMILKEADKRQELFITSTNTENAKLIIEYQAPKTY